MATRYSSKAQSKVRRALHEMEEGTLKSGRSGTKVISRKQAIAIGLSEAREEGAKVPPPPKKAVKKVVRKKATTKKNTVVRKKVAKKAAPKKAASHRTVPGSL